MTYQALMTTTQIKAIAPEINNNIDNTIIESILKICQEQKIRPVLGYNYYDDLMLQVSGGSITTEDQYILDNYLYRVISLEVFKRLVLYTSFQLENAGLRVKLSDVSQPAEVKDINLMRSDAQDQIDFLINEMDKYMNEYKTSYPKYFTSRNSRGENTMDESRRKYDYGFSISKIGSCLDLDYKTTYLDFE